MKKIKIVEFIGRLQDGGAETLVKDYALLLDKNKFDVTILCEDYVKDSNIYKTLINNDINIVTMYEKSFFINKVLARLFGKKYVSILFKKAINYLRPNVLHIHLELLEILYHARNSLDNIKLFYTCHNPPELLIGSNKPAEEKACKYLIKNNNFQIIALHDDMAKEINEMFDIKSTKVIRNGINFEKFKNIKITKNEIRKKISVNEDAYVIGQVGRFAYQKNPEWTIKVFNELLKKKENAILLLIGRGKKEDELKKLIKQLNIENKVKILVGRDDIPELLKAMDVFILPSRFEGLGIVLIEAQVAGLPCVVSDNVNKEVYRSKQITSLSLDEDIDKWVDALLNPIGNIKEYYDINEYDMNKEIKNLEELYLNL